MGGNWGKNVKRHSYSCSWYFTNQTLDFTILILKLFPFSLTKQDRKGKLVNFILFSIPFSLTKQDILQFSNYSINIPNNGLSYILTISNFQSQF